MADNEKAAGIPIEDEALDNVAGGIALTPDTAYDVRLLQPIDDFNEACDMVKTALNRQNNPDNNYTTPSDRLNMTMEDYMKEGLRNSLENKK